MSGRIPHDATLDVKAAFHDVYERLSKLEAQWTLIEGNRITGAQDAVTPTGLTTLRQVQSVESSLRNRISDVVSVIDTLISKNNLVQ